MIPARWTFREPSSGETIDRLARALDLHPVVCQILAQRGFETPESITGFLRPDLTSIHNPFLLKDMHHAVERIDHALKKGHPMLVYGDYDVDGITASAMLAECLTGYGGNVQVRLPNRVTEGYGLHPRVIEEAHRNGITLIITVDCGTSDHEAATRARDLGIDLIITDHHHPPDTLPEAAALINPKQPDCPYPYKDLAGVGVALKLVQALALSRQGRQMSLHQVGYWPEALNRYLDLVCLGTIADVMPLTGENRVLVKFGLEALRDTTRPGLWALKEATGINGKEMTSGAVGFVLAPRINATGRLQGPEAGLRLLMTPSPQEGEHLARLLNQQNQKRREVEEGILRTAHRKIKEELDLDAEMAIILADPDWHPGVIGIVAQKLVEEFYRPTILISLQSGIGKGSARSIPCIHLYALLDHCRHLLKDFGGHARAAGLTIDEGMIPAFRKRANEVLNEQYIREELVPEMTIDAVIDGHSLDSSLIEQLEILGPFGSSNPEPALCLKGLCSTAPPRLLKDAHLKIRFRGASGIHEAIGFNMRHVWERMTGSLGERAWDVVFYPQINNWQGVRTIQLRLKDIKAHDSH
ncbi:MAG: single-stranded-DNA-specific exonuclease RecJ [bacterium]